MRKYLTYLQGHFENNGFIDYEDYADPSPLIVGGSYNNLDSEIDSGISGEYQDPQQFSSNTSSNGDYYPSSGSINSSHFRSSPASLNRQRMISTPTRASVVISPLNTRTIAKNIKNATMNHQSSPQYNKRIPTTLNHRRSVENQ